MRTWRVVLRAILPTVSSGLLALLQSVVAILHWFPTLVYGTRVANLTTSRLVFYINTLGPTWIIAFGASAVTIIIALLFRRRLLSTAHALCGAVWMGYSVALWFGAIGSPPLGPVLLPCLTTTLAFAHIVMGIAYADLEEVILDAIDRGGGRGDVAAGGDHHVPGHSDHDPRSTE